MEAVLSAEPLVTAIEYLSVGCPVTMAEIEEVGQEGAVVSMAVRMGAVVRLIDNIVLPPLVQSEAFAPQPPPPQQQQQQQPLATSTSDVSDSRGVASVSADSNASWRRQQ